MSETTTVAAAAAAVEASDAASTANAPTSTVPAATLPTATSATAPAPGVVMHGPTGGRLDAISWDMYFMSIAQLSALRSKDPNTRVGACVVDSHRRIVSIGYNGFPAGCADDALPWAREAATTLDTKYLYVVHAEANALLNGGGTSMRGCSLYVALFPCCECAKLAIQAGIREIVYLSDKYASTPSMIASRRMFALAGVSTRQFVPPQAALSITFDA